MRLHKLLYIRASHTVVQIASCSSVLGQGAKWGLTASPGLPSQVLHLEQGCIPQGEEPYPKMHKGVIWASSWAASAWLGIFRGKGGKRGGGISCGGLRHAYPPGILQFSKMKD